MIHLLRMQGSVACYCVLFFIGLELINGDPHYFLQAKRSIYYNETGYATGPKDKSLFDKVAEEYDGKKDNNMVLKCCAEFEIVYADFIRVINLERPETYSAKCFCSCLLRELQIIDRDSEPRTTAINVGMRGFFWAIKPILKRFMFPGEDSIYEGIDIEALLKKGKKMGLACLNKLEPPPEHKCEGAYNFWKCASEHDDFVSLKKTVMEIRTRRFANEKKKMIANGVHIEKGELKEVLIVIE